MTRRPAATSPAPTSPGTTHDAARVYGNLRTAHLERFARMVPADVLFTRTRYDYDETAAAPGTRPVRLSRIGVVRHLLTHRYRAVELNEPLAANRWLDVAAQLVAIRLRSGLGRRRTRVSAYCIGYSDPAAEAVDKRPWLPFPLARLTTRVMANVLVRGMDRLAFGTTGCRDLYTGYVGRRALEPKSALFEALPAPCDCPSVPAVESAPLLFVGAFQERKGIRQLMAAWEVLHAAHPDQRLHLVGKGTLLDEVTAWAAPRPEVELDVDPPRPHIHAALRQAKALVLLSQRVGAWREQIGLPIVEGLQHGLEIVTTSETGLAPWLDAHGHVVVGPQDTPASVAAGIRRALTSGRSRAELLSELPDTDRRIAADRWMLGDDPR